MTVSPTATPRAADGTKWVAISTRPSVSAPQRCLSLPSHRIAVPGGTGQAAASCSPAAAACARERFQLCGFVVRRTFAGGARRGWFADPARGGWAGRAGRRPRGTAFRPISTHVSPPLIAALLCPARSGGDDARPDRPLEGGRRQANFAGRPRCGPKKIQIRDIAHR